MDTKVGDRFRNDNGNVYEIIGIVKNHPNYPEGLIEIVLDGDHIPYYIPTNVITDKLTKLT